MSEQIPCTRCHGSGRVGYVMADGRRGKTRCPDCQGVPTERKAYVEGTMRNQRTLPLSEVPQAVWDALRDPWATRAVDVEALVDEEQWR